VRIGIPAETAPGETRVAATPETVGKLAANHQIIVQSGAGLMACLIDGAYVAAGAIIGSAEQAFGCDVVLKVRAPDAGERALMKPGAILIGMLNPFQPL
jgi:NAD(P) transhydrogenase subunit alpha